MKLLIVRHADPDYSVDSLTETGRKEAEALAEYLKTIRVDYCYVSPLGRAGDTADMYLKETDACAEVIEWLREFYCPITGKRILGPEATLCDWDWLPADWLRRPGFLDKDKWMEEPEFAKAGMKSFYMKVCGGFDELLERHGYERDGYLYKAVKPNHDVIVLFCHFGVECVLLSHLLNLSPMILWHGFCAAPSSITTVITEEREQGIASWRVSQFGDISHLRSKGMEPSFSARFCECFTDDTHH